MVRIDMSLKIYVKPDINNQISAGMIQMLESRGLVTYHCKGAPRLAKITLRMDEDEVSQALGDKALLAGILDDVSCIAK